MKNIAIATLPLLLAACVSENYITDVTSDSYQEEYKTAKIEAPVVSQSQQSGVVEEVDSFVKMLPTTSQPVWENYKMVNGTKWFTVLYGDYATRLEAKKAISTLPSSLKNLKPFVKSIDDIKNSEYPTLNKLN